MKYCLAILLLLVVGCGKSEQAQDQPSSETAQNKQPSGGTTQPEQQQSVKQPSQETEQEAIAALNQTQSEQPAEQPTEQTVGTITNTISMKLNLIPAGTFLIGSPSDETDRVDGHQHQVTISKAFYMQTTEVTQAQWKAVMGTEPWKGKPRVKEGPNYPAVHVSWNDAVAYCKKLSEKESKTYRLPTEAEWEYACRAGSTTTWSFGNDGKSLGDYAWYDKNAWDIGEKYAHQVGLKKPNQFGLYDMHGNVYEWCHDYFEENYYKQSPEKDPTGPSRGSHRVFRGGSCLHDSGLTRSASRRRDVAVDRFFNLGFRLVRESEQSKEGPSNETAQNEQQQSEKQPSGETEQAAIAALEKLDAKIEKDDDGHVVGIDLFNTKITAVGLVHLKELTSLTKLYLIKTNITDAGLVHLKGMTELEELDLMLTQVTDAGLVHLKGLTNLKHLGLSETTTTDAGLVHLKGLLSLESLWLPDQITDAGLEHLKGLTKLTTLSLSGSQITDAGLAFLKRATNLELLALNTTETTDAGLQHLKGLTKLTRLHLGSSKTTDAGLEHLKGLTNLTHLELNGTQITDAGLEHLKGLTRLKFLGITNTQITPTGVADLQKALPNCKILR